MSYNPAEHTGDWDEYEQQCEDNCNYFANLEKEEAVLKEKLEAYNKQYVTPELKDLRDEFCANCANHRDGDGEWHSNECHFNSVKRSDVEMCMICENGECPLACAPDKWYHDKQIAVAAREVVEARTDLSGPYTALVKFTDIMRSDSPVARGEWGNESSTF